MKREFLFVIVAFIAIICIMSAGCTTVQTSTNDEKKDKLVIDYEIVDTTLVNDTLIEREYSFSYLGRNWNVVAKVPQERYENYVAEKYVVYKVKNGEYEPPRQRAFIKDKYVGDFVEQIKTQNGVLTDTELIEVLTYFVQTQIKYVSDQELYGKDYVAYPMQALINGAGDCDCHAALLAGLFNHAGYDSIYVGILPKNLNTGHALVGIHCDNLELTSTAKYIIHNEKKYYLIETTVKMPIGKGTFMNEDVDEWREIHGKGFRTLYEDDEIESWNNYITREYGFK